MSIDEEDLLKFLVESRSVREIEQRYEGIPSYDVDLIIDKLENEEKIRYVEGRNKAKYQTVNNDFEGEMKKAIALLAGYHCTNPTCRTFTTAPAKLKENKILKTGEAAHIHSSRKKGPRYDEGKSNSKIENGIWLCRICHKKIDGPDWEHYTPELLYNWKEEHSKWLRGNVGVPFNLIKIKKISLSFVKWKKSLRRDRKAIYKVKSFTSKYEGLLKKYLKDDKPTLKSIRIIGPRGVGKKTILVDVLEQLSEEKLDNTIVFIHEDNEILNLEFSDDIIIIIQECSNNFHETLYRKLDAFGYVNITLISSGVDNYEAGIVKEHTDLMKVEEFDKYQMAELIMNIYPSLTTQQSNKIIEMSGGIPATAFDVYSYFDQEKITLDKIDQSWQLWKSRIDKYSKQESFPKEEVLNIMQKFALIGEISYYNDPTTRRQYLGYIRRGEIEKTELIMNSLIDYGFFKVRNLTLTLNPPFMSLYLLKEIKEEEIKDHIKQLISGKNKGFLSQFLRKIFMLKEEQIQIFVAWALFDELESNWNSLADSFHATIIYHLSDFLPEQVLNIIENLLTNHITQQNLECNILVIITLEKLSEKSEFFFQVFNLMIKLAIIIKRNDFLVVLSRTFLNGVLDFSIKLDFINHKIDLDNEDESYIIIDLLCSLIYPYTIEPHRISNYYGPEGEKHEIEFNYLHLDSVLNLLESFLKSPNDNVRKHLFYSISEKVLTLFANGKWEWLKTLFEKIIEGIPSLKLNVLESIKFGDHLKNLVPEKIYRQIAGWVAKIEKELKIEDRIEWFFNIKRQIYDTGPIQKKEKEKFVQQFLDDKSLFKESLPYLIRSELFEMAEMGETIANLDENFSLWPLIEEIFIKDIKNSNTLFINGYTYVIFKKDPAKWEKILSKFESIPEFEPKLYQLIIPKYPFKDHLDKLIELYKKGVFPIETITRMRVFSVKRLKLLTREELAKLIKFYFNEVPNKTDGGNLLFLDNLLDAQEYVLPNGLDDLIIEILTAFEDFDEFNAYLPKLWNDLIEKISEKNPKFVTKIRQKLVNNFNAIPYRIIIDIIGSIIEVLLQKDYEKTIEQLRKILETSGIKYKKLEYILNEKRINLINVEDQISFCKNFPKLIGHIIGFHTSELLTQKKITLFFEKLVDSFQYKYNISKKTCLAILRALPKRDKAIVEKHINVLENLKRETTNEPIKYWLSGVIKCLMKKIGEY